MNEKAIGDQPAFPSSEVHLAGTPFEKHTNLPGMSLRAYAAIALRIPDSGDPLLNVMIQDAVRRDIATATLQGILTGLLPVENPLTDEMINGWMTCSVKMADHLLYELEKRRR